MNFTKSKVLLKKISAIHDSVAAFGGTFSQLEKDLILQYLRDLYECINLDQDVTKPDPQNISQAGPTTTSAPPVAQTEYIQPASSIGSTPSTNGSATHVATSVAKPKKIKTNPDLEELFEESTLEDLSQRFANAPIKDISKAMGINERILTINELFKGDQQSFQETADALNSCTSFEAAKQYLVQGVATKNEWASNKRKKKAAVFIKLVRRRYL